jgi:hypothetical protein
MARRIERLVFVFDANAGLLGADLPPRLHGSGAGSS